MLSATETPSGPWHAAQTRATVARPASMSAALASAANAAATSPMMTCFLRPPLELRERSGQREARARLHRRDVARIVDRAGCIHVVAEVRGVDELSHATLRHKDIR